MAVKLDFWFRMAPAGLYQRLIRNDDWAAGEEELIMLYPVREAVRFSKDRSVKPCTGPVAVPAGTFECLIYRQQHSKNSWSDSYVTPGIGLIKSASFNDGALVFSSELVSYDVRQRD